MKKLNFNPISISTHGNLIIFGFWVKGVNLRGTNSERLIIKWLDLKYEVKKKLRYKGYV